MSGSVFKPFRVFSLGQPFEEALFFFLLNPMFTDEEVEIKELKQSQCHHSRTYALNTLQLCLTHPFSKYHVRLLCTWHLLSVLTCLALPEHAWVFSGSFSSLNLEKNRPDLLAGCQGLLDPKIQLRWCFYEALC